MSSNATINIYVKNQTLGIAKINKRTYRASIEYETDEKEVRNAAYELENEITANFIVRVIEYFVRIAIEERLKNVDITINLRYVKLSTKAADLIASYYEGDEIINSITFVNHIEESEENAGEA